MTHPEGRQELDPAIEGARLKQETLGLASQFGDNEFPFSEGRSGNSIPGKVVGYEWGGIETKIISGAFVLGPSGVSLHMVGSEMRIGGGMVPYVTARVRPATDMEYFKLREAIANTNKQLTELQIKRGNS